MQALRRACLGRVTRPSRPISKTGGIDVARPSTGRTGHKALGHGQSLARNLCIVQLDIVRREEASGSRALVLASPPVLAGELDLDDLVALGEIEFASEDWWAGKNPVSYTHLTLPTKRIV